MGVSLKDKIYDDMTVEEFIEYELSAQMKLYSKALKGTGIQFNFPTVEQAVTVATFGSYTNSSSFANYLNSLEAQFFNIWDSNIREGYLIGDTTQNIVRKVVGKQAGNAQLAEAGAMHSFKNSVMANTRTALQAMANDTRKLVMEKNEELISGYEWVGTLDRRTCLVCGNLDGKVKKHITDFTDQPPLHFNCRCLIIPKIDGYDELDKDDTRASENGEVPADMSYDAWLRTQPEEVQKEVLGKTRYALFKETGSVGDFVNDGKVIPLKDLFSANDNSNMVEYSSRDITDRVSEIGLSSNMSSNEKRKRIELWLIEEGKKSGLEKCIVTDLENNVLYINEGSVNSVGDSGSVFERRAREKMGNFEMKFYHNHPSNSTLSKADWNRMLNPNSPYYKLYGETIAVGHNGVTYSLKFGNFANYNINDFKYAFNNMENEYKTLIMKHLTLSPIELNKYLVKFRDVIYSNICADFGLIYEKKE